MLAPDALKQQLQEANDKNQELFSSWRSQGVLRVFSRWNRETNQNFFQIELSG